MATQLPQVVQPAGETRRNWVGASAGNQIASRGQPTTISPTVLQRTYGNRALGAYVRRSAHTPGCGCPACSNLQRASESSPGSQVIQRDAHEEGCNCPDCASLQRKPENESAHGAACGCSMCGIVQRAVDYAVQSDLPDFPTRANNSQQAAMTPAYSTQHKIQRSPVRIEKRAPATPHALIQRHSSWEHMLIGELETDEIMQLGAAYDVANNGPTTINTSQGPKQINANNIQHLIEQEIRRLSFMMDSEPQIKKSKVTDKTTGNLDWQKVNIAKQNEEARFNAMDRQVDHNSTWQVEFVLIKTTEGELLPVTYGEMNTLADFYGSLDELKEADPSWLKRVIRGVRMSSVEKLTKMYKETTGRTDKQLKQGVGNLQSRTAMMPIGPTSDIWMGSDAGELRQMGVLPSSDEKALSGNKLSTSYTATLARNACHFAPESWHQWADYHAKARREAALSHAAATAGDKAKHRNEALLNNGFGDHYLQDSYAAGHLINKTQIMQWYVQWIDTDASDRWKQYFDKNWRKIQQIAYNQPEMTAGSQYNKGNVRQGNQSTARNPQAARTNNPNYDWRNAANTLHLQAPGSISDPNGSTLLTWWQNKTANQWRIRNPRKQSFQTIRNDAFAGNSMNARRGLLKLLQDGIARSADYKTSQLAYYKTLNALTFAPKAGDSFYLRDEYAVSSTDRLPNSQQESQDKATAVAFQDYKEFIRSTFLQKATNALHNYFCKHGLEVAADAGPLFKVYGDDNMFKDGAASGLKHSSETAKMSKQAILDIASTGASNISQAAILARLPSKVKLANYVQDPSIKADKTGDKIVEGQLPPVPGASWKAPGKTVSLEEWHNGKMGESGPLRDFCFNLLFPAMTDERGGNIMGPMFMSDLGLATPERVHEGDTF